MSILWNCCVYLHLLPSSLHHQGWIRPPVAGAFLLCHHHAGDGPGPSKARAAPRLGLVPLGMCPWSSLFTLEGSRDQHGTLPEPGARADAPGWVLRSQARKPAGYCHHSPPPARLSVNSWGEGWRIPVPCSCHSRFRGNDVENVTSSICLWVLSCGWSGEAIDLLEKKGLMYVTPILDKRTAGEAFLA